MNAREILLHTLHCLERHSIPYMVVGSFSSNLYGTPRSTKDADVVIQLASESISVISADLGDQFRLDPQLSFELATATSRYIIQHRFSAFKVELFLLSDDPHDRARWQRRVHTAFEGEEAWVPTPEDVVVTKLRWAVRAGRPKDQDDVYRVLAVQQGQLDMDYIRGWCDKHGTRALLEELISKLPPI